ANATEVLPDQGADRGRGFFGAEAQTEVVQRHAPMPCVERPGKRSTRPPQMRHDAQWERLQRSDDRARQAVEQQVHCSAKTDFLHAVVKVLGSAENLDLDPHEVNREVAAVDLRKAHGILLRRDDGVGLAFLAPVDDIQHLLLSEPMVVGKTLRVNELAADLREAQFEAFRLCNPTERGDLPALDQIEAMAFAREYVFEVKRVMHTLDDPGGAV